MQYLESSKLKINKIKLTSIIKSFFNLLLTPLFILTHSHLSLVKVFVRSVDRNAVYSQVRAYCSCDIFEKNINIIETNN